MVRTVVAGLDGSAESRAAAEWAAREAASRDLPLKLLHVSEPVPEPTAQAPLLGGETLQYWSEKIPRDAADGIRQRHPGLEVEMQNVSGRPAEILAEAADDAELLVLGSGRLSGISGFLLGSVGLAVVAHVDRPVVLVRAGEEAADEHEPDPAGTAAAGTPFRPVVLGLDVDDPDDSMIGFAFEEAARRETALRVVSGWNLPPYYVYGLSLDPQYHDEIARQKAAGLSEILTAWRHKYPTVEVVEMSRPGSPGRLLVDASHEASLVVVGRKVRRRSFGAHIGPVTHAVLHHCTVPVAVLPHH
ncbi:MULTISPECIES: universal stress protein [unclassified Streptomyces]|jgi:nucleotide-binding universal stress UspA family protein|uniref:universal stress protein n=1 Tax=unclassified Streptomyces TaxID=2593676 RepID=UPI000F4EFB34|nr:MULTISPECIES: universal stress protein [unclassified Streptomyces]MDH6447644.1 nucleotide-binding universal stress UspA family protein [Streptomyces sp. SAI-119]MDH6501633.1 nucleotide-binding universal stress UspA family protein [Streptomyces sp. SAI-149]QUC59939.1 universal stress protein [Streptomyces sp. A2-16]